jgi:hypothetical protein
MKTIKQFIAEHLINTEIFEMARSLDDYKNLIKSQIEPIISHVILIMKAREENSDEFVTHWKKEIRGFLSNFIGTKLKTKNNYESRRKHIENILYNEYELNTDEDEIFGIIRRKLFNEGYDLEDNKIHDTFLQIVQNFQNEYLDEIVDIMASDSTSKIQQFINKL